MINFILLANKNDKIIIKVRSGIYDIYYLFLFTRGCLMSKLINCFSRFLYSLIKKLSPSHILILGFIFLDLIAAFLLWLPISNKYNNISFIDAFFTATSALSVTGLTVKNTFLQFSLFGKIIIMLLIEIGGLGFMTIITSFFIFLGKKITLKERLIIQESLNQLNYKGVVALVKKIFYWVLIIQGIGALILSIRFMFEKNNNFIWAIFLGVFHSISAYCNAGFDLIGTKNLSPYVGDLTINLIIMALIFFGGVGYTVVADFLRVFRDLAYKKLSFRQKIDRLKLHSKLVIVTNAILIFTGALLFFLYEINNNLTLKNLSFGQKILAAFFESITTRTAGFFSIDQNSLSVNSKLLAIILMFIGGSPGSTAGGVKTVTFTVLILSIVSAVKAKKNIEAFGRTISFHTLQRTIAIISLNFLAIFISTQIISLFYPEFDFIDILFEITSAVGTVGLGLGISEKVSWVFKLLICLDMIIGKVGPVSIAMLLLTKSKNSTEKLMTYPEEKIIVG